MELSVENHIQEVEQGLTEIQRKAIPAAIVYGLNKTHKQITVQTRKQVARKVNVPDKVIKNRIQSVKAKRKTPSIAITLFRQAISYSEFGSMRQVKAGVSTSKHGTFKGAFIARMPHGGKNGRNELAGPLQPGQSKMLKLGHKGVFFRPTKKNNRRGTARKVKSGKTIGQTYRPALSVRERRLPILREDGKILYTLAEKHVDQTFPIQFKFELRKRIAKAEKKAKAKAKDK